MPPRQNTVLFSFAAAALLIASPAPAWAQSSCQDDFQKLSTKRLAQIQKLNAIGKAGKGKIDPIAACPVARALAGVDTEMLNYMLKNKEWCSIPDNVVEQFTAGRTRDQTFASQACAAAVKAKQIQEQQRAQAGNPALQPQRLPAGPL
jgi:hypothetical protein